MLPEKQQLANSVTYFSLPVQKNGNWKIEVTRNDKVIKTGYAFTKEDASILRGKWIDLFWGKSLN